MATKQEIADALGLTLDQTDTMVALVVGLSESGLTAETATVYAGDLGMARMQTVLDGLAQALDAGVDGGATATAALASARSTVSASKSTVASIRAAGGDRAAAQAAVVAAAQATAAAALAVGEWKTAILAAIPQG